MTAQPIFEPLPQEPAPIVRPPRKTALRLISTKDMQRQEWLQVRHTGIGSSDAAAAVGLNPYQSQLELWMVKTGRQDLLPMDDGLDSRSPMYWGTVLEPIVAEQYARRTGHKVRRVNAVLQHPEHPWMLANIDREVLGSDEVQILECKTAGLHGAKLWRDGVPEYVQLQVMHQLAVTGKQAADIAVLIAGQDLQIHRIERNEAMIEQLIALEKRFWQWVQDDIAPDADGSDSADLALRCLYPEDRGETVDWRNDADKGALFGDLLAVREQLSKYQKLEAKFKQAITQAMEGASLALFELGSVSWKKAKDSLVLDAAALEQDYPDLVNSYRKPRQGSRRFMVHAGK